MELSFAAIHEQNWHNSMWYYPYGQALFYSQLNEESQKKYPQILIKDSLAYLGEELLSRKHETEVYFPYHPRLIKKYPQANYYYIQKKQSTKAKGIVLFFGKNEYWESLSLIEEWAKKHAKKNQLPLVLWANIQSSAENFENLLKVQKCLSILERYFGRLQFLNHEDPWLWQLDYSQYEFHDLGSEKLVYYNCLYLFALLKGAQVAAYPEIKTDISTHQMSTIERVSPHYEIVLLKSK